jgi:signal transduction histidine kinase
VLIPLITILRVVVAPQPLLTTAVALLVSVFFVFIHLRLRKTKKLKGEGYFLLLSFIVLVINGGLSNGGLRAPVVTGAVLFPIVSAAALGRRGVWLGLLAMIATVAVVAWMQIVGLSAPFREETVMSVYPVMLFGVTIVGVAIISNFEKARVESHQELVATSQKLSSAAKLASLGEMANGVAHEINNPLMIIRGRIEILAKKVRLNNGGSEEIALEIEKLNYTVDRIAKIIEGLRYFSSKEEISIRQELSVQDLINDAVSLCDEKIKMTGVRLQVFSPGQYNVFGQRTQIVQAFFNLVINAIEAASAQENKWVLIKVETQPTKVIVAIEDSGPGIAAEIQEKMMLPFFTTKPIGEGTGLGLSVAQGLLQANGGNLSYDEKSVNTRFVVEFRS